ncbi:polysaccharide pyruvyl transferase family protein [Clostridium sp. 1001271B_151109_B4]|uniref:polysaccharide pyruvyl transferase family protein n=1 Tax=Clostridium sp. 1001271B_151109_B4 TaxID=2787148 RepID=UPI0018A9F4B2|nr:polysaccharide pyruvyl transferase family protein [Clostridium sp. 1001271B_151109_B4]
MKIAIITMSNGVNYGNRLQNYAMQRVLESLGADVETIINYTGQEIINENSLKEKIKDFLAEVNYNIPKFKIAKLDYILRERRFKKFNKKNIKQTDYFITKDNIPDNINQKYNYFVCGSDQIWNPEFQINSHIDFLSFAEKGKKIAYAPSFGVSELPKDCIDKYKEWINGIDYLSVREEAGAEIIKNITEREAVVLLDPTLMLNKSEWLKIVEKPKLQLRKKYILTYFLGSKEKEVENRILKIAEEYNYEIINLMDEKNKYIYSVDPAEFVWLINNCELFCTDSFHGGVFSIIMKKAFIIFERKDKLQSMNSRLETLLSKFNMENRLDKNIVSNGQIFNIDFSNVDKIISAEKEKTITYLKNSLNIK